MDKSIIIRQERKEDFRSIRDLIRSAFEQVAESDHREHLLVDRLRLSNSYLPALSLVAETIEGKILGHILLSTAELIGQEQTTTILALAPLSIHPLYQRKGLGGLLIREAHQRAQRLGYPAIVVLGDPNYYTRFGYQEASAFGLHFPFDVPKRYCMAIELQPNRLKGLVGEVRYPDAFTQQT